MAEKYTEQQQKIKSRCFIDASADFYSDHKLIDSLRNLLTKPQKTAFEQVLARYYPYQVTDLNYQQAVLYIYQEDYAKAVTLMQAAGSGANTELAANPFSSRLNDCHDCDAAAPTKQHYTPLSFLNTMQSIHGEIAAGKDMYRNAWLLANAFYNITHYGNSRAFYEDALNRSSVYQPEDLPGAFLNIFTSPALAHKYYQLALSKAVNNEQRARCTFMLSKCARNNAYSNAFIRHDATDAWQNWKQIPSDSTYFAVLNNKYRQTQYYREVIKECGYFRDFVNQPKEKKNR